MTNERRSPWAAGLLSLVIPGLGHVYNGEPGLGLLAYLSQPVLFAFGNILFFATFPGTVAVLTLLLALYLGIAVHAALRARRLGEVSLRWYNHVAVYLLVGVGVSILGGLTFKHVVLPALRYRTFQTAAASMEPSLQIGDHFIVDTWAYRKQPPQRGDLIVFRFPNDPARDFVKRCVAVSGDVVAIHDKQLSIDGQPVAEPYVTHVDPEVLHDTGLSPVAVRDQYGPEKIPPGSCFSLGDNRDNSYDSRFYGSVRPDLLEAKALYVYWSKNGSRMGRRLR